MTLIYIKNLKQMLKILHLQKNISVGVLEND